MLFRRTVLSEYHAFASLFVFLFSNFLRLKMLYNNGGAWFDASTIIDNPVF